jgi:hypothetical protein
MDFVRQLLSNDEMKTPERAFQKTKTEVSRTTNMRIFSGDSPLLVALKISTAILMVIAASMIIYTTVTDGSPLRLELLTPWMKATLVDFYTNVRKFN